MDEDEMKYRTASPYATNCSAGVEMEPGGPAEIHTKKAKRRYRRYLADPVAMMTGMSVN